MSDDDVFGNLIVHMYGYYRDGRNWKILITRETKDKRHPRRDITRLRRFLSFQLFLYLIRSLESTRLLLETLQFVQLEWHRERYLRLQTHKTKCLINIPSLLSQLVSSAYLTRDCYRNRHTTNKSFESTFNNGLGRSLRYGNEHVCDYLNMISTTRTRSLLRDRFYFAWKV